MQYSTLTLAALVGIAQAVDVHVVSVGWNPVNNATGLKYWPEKVEAAVGDMVQFQFWAGAHTITQSNFDNVCTPINEVNSEVEGIDSGSQPVAASADAGEIPTYTVMITDEAPMWFYCATGPHCQEGMALVINENTAGNATRSLENYKALAAGEPIDASEPEDDNETPESGNGGNAGGNGGGAGGDAGNEDEGTGEIVGDDGSPVIGPDGTPIAGDGASATGESSVPAAAVSTYGTPSTFLLALGAAFMLL